MLAAVIPALSHGCASAGSDLPDLPPSPAAVSEYVVRPGDELELKFFYTPELNEVQLVRPDGRIAAPLVGEVEVAGKTPEVVREDLNERYLRYLNDPSLTVLIRGYAENRIYVGGRVLAPGLVDLHGRVTVLEAIMTCGGLDPRTAEPSNVVVIRHQGAKRFGYRVDLTPTLRGEESAPFYLQPKDIVHVPQTRIAAVGQWVDLYIEDLIPKTGFKYTKTSGDTTIGIDTASR